MTAFCVVCGRSALGTCPLCRSVCYCSRSCQKLDWLEDHATICGAEVLSAEEFHIGHGASREEAPSLSKEVEAWRVAVESLWLELHSEEDLDHLSELQPLLTDAEQLRKVGSNFSWQVPRSELQLGSSCILITAPHSMALLRDGHVPHLLERHTAEIAFGLARHLDGSCLTWSFAERRRTELLWRLSRRLNEQRGAQTGNTDGHLLDPRNRDPNFLATQELHQNAWFQQMIRALEHMISQDDMGLQTSLSLNGVKGGKYNMLEALHIDVHGCQDPPSTPSPLTVGLGAMCFNALDHGDLKAYDQAVFFGQVLAKEFHCVLTNAHVSYRLPPSGALLVRLVAPKQGRDEECPRFSGAWRGTDRHTQSQQAVCFVGFSHAVQLELSKSLRALLVADRALLKGFALALKNAWVQAKVAQRAVAYGNGHGIGEDVGEEDENRFTTFQ